MGPFSRFPLDLTLLILQDLTPHDIVSLRLVNREYYQLFTSDFVCQEGLKLFFADCWEYRGQITEASNRESGRVDGGHNSCNLLRGRELFDKVYLRRERFRACRPTSFSSINSRWSDKSNCKLSQTDGLLFILHPGGGPLAIELYDLYHPKYNDDGELVGNAVVPLFGAGNDCSCDGDLEENEDQMPDSEYVGSALIATKSPLVELKSSSRARRPLRSHQGARATRSDRGKRQRRTPNPSSDYPNISAAFDLTSTNPFAAAQDGVLLFTAHFHEQHWTPCNEHGILEVGRMCPTAFIAVSTVRGDSFGKVIQAWTSPTQLYIPSSDDRDNPTATVNRHVAVWRDNCVGAPPFNASRENLRVLPLRGRSPITSTKPRRLNQREYEQSVVSVMVDIPFSEIPPSNKCRAIAVDRDAEMMFYAAGGRNAGVLVFVFAIHWDTYGSKVKDITKLSMVKLGGISILKEMERAEGPGYIDIHSDRPYNYHHQSLHFEIPSSLSPATKTQDNRGAADSSHFHYHSKDSARTHISLVFRAQLVNIPGGTTFKTESCLLWRIPVPVSSSNPAPSLPTRPSIGITHNESTIDDTPHHSEILPVKVLFQKNRRGDTGPFEINEVIGGSEFSGPIETTMNRARIYAQHDPDDYLDHQSPMPGPCQSVFGSPTQLPRTAYIGTGKVESTTATTVTLSRDGDPDLEKPLVSSVCSFPVQYILPRSLGASCQHAFRAGDQIDGVLASIGQSERVITRVKIPVFGRVPRLCRLPAVAHAWNTTSSTGTTEDEYESMAAVLVVGNEWFVGLELGREYISPKLSKQLEPEKPQCFMIPAAFGTDVTVLGVGDGWIAWECMFINRHEILWKVCVARYD